MHDTGWCFTVLEKKCVEILHLFSSFIWSHLYASKESQQIDIILIFTSLKCSFSFSAQLSNGDPPRHDSTAGYLRQRRLVPTNRPRGTGGFSHVSVALHLPPILLSHDHRSALKRTLSGGYYSIFSLNFEIDEPSLSLLTQKAKCGIHHVREMLLSGSGDNACL